MKNRHARKQAHIDLHAFGEVRDPAVHLWHTQHQKFVFYIANDRGVELVWHGALNRQLHMLPHAQIQRRVCKYAKATSLSCMRGVSVTSSVRCWAASGGSAFSQVEKCSGKSGAFNSVVEAFVLMRMVGCFVSRAGKSVFRRDRTWWPSCTISPVCSEFEMKVYGGTSPSNGSVQRERASKPTVDASNICTNGW